MASVERVHSIKHAELLTNLKKAVEYWITQSTSTYEEASHVKRSLTDILLDGFDFPPKTAEGIYGACENCLDKLVEDFEWLGRTAQIRNSFGDGGSHAGDDGGGLCLQPPEANSRPDYGETSITLSPPLSTSSASSHSTTTNALHIAEHFLYEWVSRNLRAHCLCACLQTLGTDGELLSFYYNEHAFMRNENFATAMFICITAYELNQSNLLSQIAPNLCNATLMHGSALAGDVCRKKHKRTGSHPFAIALTSPKKTSEASGVRPTKKSESILPTLRKANSLPVMEWQSGEAPAEEQSTQTTNRPRSKTVHERRGRHEQAAPTQPQTIPNFPNNRQAAASPSSIPPPTPGDSSGGYSLSSGCAEDPSPSRIELIKCDNIKIWTDQSYTQPEGQEDSGSKPFNAWDIPDPKVLSKPKNISPVNGFLCSLFGTPPTYTSWSLSENSSTHGSHLQTDTSAVDATSTVKLNAYPCNKPKDAPSSSGVFDAFLPVEGKKLKSRNSSNLFDGDISAGSTAAVALNCNPSTSCAVPKDVEVVTKGSHSSSPHAPQAPLPKKSQTLAAYLQMAQQNRNETELEKENAHFFISEAIISAIEHIKWAKMEPDKKGKRPRTESAVPATDWLEGEVRTRPLGAESKRQLPEDASVEHIAYAEVGESSPELLTAEVVGLTLISKFDDQQLPTVSELKWLVSEDQAPQKLLPMPNAQSSANPDDNILPSLTRGTKYWAPPRQQIIFTDHPRYDREDLIQRQNNRCAGCGMQVAKKYLRSFRYCTYLGKYFCTGCHRNQITAIPAKILHSWDFKCYPVSVFAYRLLEMMYSYPLFYVPDLNASLYVDNKTLNSARTKRRQLSFIRDFVKTCRFAAREQKYFETVPSYISDDIDLWSLSDFIDTHNRSMHRSLDELIERCSNHIYNCVLCNARGFICECCHSQKAIYPWEAKRFRCDRCGACYHASCWVSMSETCCRCQRINKRLDNIAAADI